MKLIVIIKPDCFLCSKSSDLSKSEFFKKQSVILSETYVLLFFCLETKETKIQDSIKKAKNCMQV